MTIQAIEILDIQYDDADLANEITAIIREARSFGCNGPNDQNLYRCQLHCRRQNYKSGKCTKSSNYTRCICLKSTNSKS